MIASLEWFLVHVWRLSCQASALIILVLLVQWLAGGRISARWRYNLWLLVIVRLVIPFLWQSPFSVYNAVNWGTDRASATLRPVIQAPAPAVIPATTAPAAPGAILSQADEPAPPEPVASISAPQPAAPLAQPMLRPLKTVPTPIIRAPLSWKERLALVWFIGALLFAARVIFSSWRMQRRIRRAIPITEPEVLALLDECRQRMGLRRLLSARETDAVQSPAVFGFWRPQLLLPTGLAQSFSLAELRHIFLHEFAHVRRLDLPMNWLLSLLQVLHWFNPIIWFGLRRMRADRESACDALAIERNSGSAPKEYGLTIIKLLENAATATQAPGVMGILESKSQMVRRVRMIARFRQNPRWSWLAITLTAALAFVGLTDAGRRVRAEVVKAVESEKTMKITVVEAGTGRPVAGVTLSAGVEGDPAQPLRKIKTDAAGIAQVPLFFGQSFIAVHPDYAPVAWNQNPYRHNLTPPNECTINLEHGTTLGGIVRDEAGHPVAGVTAEVRGVEENANLPQSPDFSQQAMFAPPPHAEVVTDAQGRWSYPNFPMSIDDLLITFKRPDGARYEIHSPSKNSYFMLHGVAVPNAQKIAAEQKLVTTLPEGIEVRGVVHDTAGRPLAGITVTERDNRDRARPIFVSKTDAQGRFSLPHRDPHQILLVFSGDGLATGLRVLTVMPGLAEQEVALAPAAPLRVRVVDAAGAPIAGATIMLTELETGWSAKTDAEGRAAWPAAPLESYPYSVGDEKHSTRILRLAPAAHEIAVALRDTGAEGTQVTVKPVGEDGQPLAAFTVSVIYENQSNGAEKLGEGRDGAFTALVPFGKTQGRGYVIRVEAPGLSTYLSANLDPFAGEPSLTPTLSASHPLQGRVLQPDGAPAEKASVILTNGEGKRTSVNLIFFSDFDMRVEAREARGVRTGADGTFTLPAAPSAIPVLLIHKQGFLATTVEQLRAAPEVRLAPWGAVEGTFTINGRPRSGQRIDLQPLNNHHPYDLYGSISAKTDADGKFRLSSVPPGPCVIYATHPSDGQWPQAYETQVEARSGEVTHLDLAGRGRTVTGRLLLNPSDAALDWKRQIATALLEENRSDALPTAFQEDFIYQRDYEEALRRPQAVMLRPTYPLTIEQDGTFRSEGLPPGKYTLRVTAQMTDPGHRNSAQDIGEVKQEITVPTAESDEPAVLGNFTLALKQNALPPRPAIQLAAETLAGRPLSLSDYAGKQVLLLFWATWAPPSAEKLAEWKRLYEAHGTDPRFVMLGVSLDDDSTAAQHYVDEHAWHWPQARIVGSEKAEATERLEVDTLPVALLIGTDGRLVARNPVESRLRSVVDAFLTPGK